MIDRTAVSTELGRTETLAITITGQNGFSGAVAITPSVVDADGKAIEGWTLTPTPASVDLSANGSAQVQLTVSIPTDAVVLTSKVKVALNGASGAALITDVSSAFTIAKQVTIDLPAAGIAPPRHITWPAPGQSITIHAGTKVVFHNGDTVPHRIHGSDGIAHEPDDLAAGADYVTTPTAVAGKVGTWWCHAHESSAAARMINVVP